MLHIRHPLIIFCCAVLLHVHSFQLRNSFPAKYKLHESKLRLPRSANKFESLKRSEREQRLIELGAITAGIATDSPREIRAHEGDTVYLPCRVPHLGTHSVTWATSGMILSVDTMLVDARPRMAVSHDGDMWRLVIKNAQESDAGEYTCSVTSIPPQHRNITLYVLPASSSITHDPHDTTLSGIRANLSLVWTELRDIREQITSIQRSLSGRPGTHPASEHHQSSSPDTPDERLLPFPHRESFHPYNEQQAFAHSQREAAVVFDEYRNTIEIASDDTENPEAAVDNDGTEHDASQQPPYDDSPLALSRLRPVGHRHRNSRRGGPRRRHQRPRPQFVTATCHLKPDDTSSAESRVTGTISLSQPADLSEGVTIDVRISGLDDSAADVLQLSLHRYAAPEGSCSRVGPTFSPSQLSRGTVELRNMEVVSGESTTRKLFQHVVLYGYNGIVGRSFVLSTAAEDVTEEGDGAGKRHA
ncbi:uncharacterized protein LOC108664983 [Hyalella azteca]|uniref:Uncharacterized protein LOC108664983 n=1 Tax=Hyalella azteca TaxID=294128 RepID=A0A8B7N021_HYAAZ|nr:uncharacterized protein LOC108664983 [Hyalella azteca]